MCEETQCRRVYNTHVCSKDTTMDDVCKHVCSKQHTTNSYSLHVSVVFSYHRWIQAIDASVVRKMLQTCLQPRPVCCPQHSPNSTDIHRSHIYIYTHKSHRNDIYIYKITIVHLKTEFVHSTHISHTVHRSIVHHQVILTCLYLTAPIVSHRLQTQFTDQMNIYTRHFIMVLYVNNETRLFHRGSVTQ